jgi:hypothetical protein
MTDPGSRRGRLRAILKWTLRIAVLLILLVSAFLLYTFSGAIYRRFVTFPREAQAWQDLRTQRVEPSLDDGWTEYRGILHSHSEYSHDSMVPYSEILAAAKKADIQFVFMTDHTNGGNADYSQGWKGIHGGVLFVRGYEMQDGFMPWGLPDDTVFPPGMDSAELARKIKEKGGLLFFAHTEEPRLYDLPQLNGMEIYNIHPDFEDEFQDGSYKELLKDILISHWSNGDQVMRRIFDPPTAILAKWDELNRNRKIVGIAANDCHQNAGIRGIYTERDTLLLRTTASDDPEDRIGEYGLNFLTRPVLRMAFGPLDAGRELFRVQIDPYERCMRFVNTHLLAPELSEPALLEALREGRAFIAFDMLADARGFTYLIEGESGRAVMGETIALKSGTVRAEAPLEVRFRLVRDGQTVHEARGRTLEYRVHEPGRYRLEAELEIRGVWTPWVYTNPITVVSPGLDQAAGEAGIASRIRVKAG